MNETLQPRVTAAHVLNGATWWDVTIDNRLIAQIDVDTDGQFSVTDVGDSQRHHERYATLRDAADAAEVAWLLKG